MKMALLRQWRQLIPVFFCFASRIISLMNDRQIARLEAQLERFVESAFATLFRKPVSAHDIAIKLARSMTAAAVIPTEGDTRPVAPDRYVIHLSTAVHSRFVQHMAQMSAELAQQMIELAGHAGYRLVAVPQIVLVADERLRHNDLEVFAEHTNPLTSSTAMMKAVEMPAPAVAGNLHLLIGDRAVPLTQPVVNIGRSDDNTIVVDDPFVSRHHIQLRMRGGACLLFDVDSKSGTFVNDVLVREHRLQSGDVIRIGNTRLIFVVDETQGRRSPGTTDILDPVKP
jgi:pSer/pThr/pTyr-binding forkhead associated (FHA) protein